jgi:hypothetical protein
VSLNSEAKEHRIHARLPANERPVSKLAPPSAHGLSVYQGVPVGQVFAPPYLFQRGGGRSARPAIVQAPNQIPYGGHFDVRVAGPADQIGSVVLLRSDHNTHSLTTGDRYVKLAFASGGRSAGGLRVKAPNLPAQAIPGVYLLFVVDKNGVPSIGRRVDIKPVSGP